eukprot:1189568-Alexandrium_andersonii.AAC.1
MRLLQQLQVARPHVGRYLAQNIKDTITVSSDYSGQMCAETALRMILRACAANGIGCGWMDENWDEDAFIEKTVK